MKLTEKQKNDITIFISGHYLTEELPIDFEEMSSQDFDDFIINNVWLPFEGWPAKDVYDVISSTAYSTVRYIEGLE